MVEHLPTFDRLADVFICSSCSRYIRILTKFFLDRMARSKSFTLNQINKFDVVRQENKIRNENRGIES